MMNKLVKILRITYIAFAFYLLPVYLVNAQDLNKDVFVVRPYEPTLSDAAKHNFLPSSGTMETSIPQFSYSISPKRLENSFEPEPIKAARTVTTSLPKIYNSWLKLGFGNYNTPLAEFNISNLRSKDYSFGAYMRHKSSHGNILLANDEKANSSYVDNYILIYGKKFYSKATLYGGLSFDQHAFHFYGYNTNLFLLPPNVDKDSLRQRTYKPGINLGIKTTGSGPQSFNADVHGSVDYFIDRYKNKETDIKVGGTFSTEVSGLLGGLDISVDYSNLHSTLDTLANTIIRINPWISKNSTDWQFKLGFEAAADIADITKFYFYPRANLDIIVIKDVLVPFVGVSGELQKNNYQNLFEENRFIKPGLSLKNTSSNFIVYAGIKGNISSLVRFRADAGITIFKDFHFFINDTLSHPELRLDNQFTGVYDDINLITYHGQLVFAPKENFELMIDGKYFDYKTFEEAKPWHKPDFSIKAEASYTYNKFDFGLGLNIIGNRWVKDYEKTDDRRKLKPVFDANLNISYHYSKLLTVFADFYNLGERSYLIWNQYPTQRFNFLFGFTYKL